jgi:hypothetical protein
VLTSFQRQFVDELETTDTEVGNTSVLTRNKKLSSAKALGITDYWPVTPADTLSSHSRFG